MNSTVLRKGPFNNHVTHGEGGVGENVTSHYEGGGFDEFYSLK